MKSIVRTVLVGSTLCVVAGACTPSAAPDRTITSREALAAAMFQPGVVELEGSVEAWQVLAWGGPQDVMRVGDAVVSLAVNHERVPAWTSREPACVRGTLGLDDPRYLGVTPSMGDSTHLRRPLALHVEAVAPVGDCGPAALRDTAGLRSRLSPDELVLKCARVRDAGDSEFTCEFSDAVADHVTFAVVAEATPGARRAVQRGGPTRVSARATYTGDELILVGEVRE